MMILVGKGFRIMFPGGIVGYGLAAFVVLLGLCWCLAWVELFG